MSQQTDKIKTLSNANEEETEIDLLELLRPFQVLCKH